jgi:hypothetical protein
VKQTRFVDPRALASKHKKGLANQQQQASKPVIEILPDDYEEDSDKKKKRSREEDDEDNEEFLKVLQEAQTTAMAEQETGMLFIEQPKPAPDNDGDDIDALFDDADAAPRQWEVLVPLPSRSTDVITMKFVNGPGSVVNNVNRFSGSGSGSVPAKTRDEIRQERLQSLKEERERDNERRRDSIRTRRPDLVDEKALHRKEAFYQHNWRQPTDAQQQQQQQQRAQKKPKHRPHQAHQAQAQRPRVIPTNGPRHVGKRVAKKRINNSKQRSSRNYRNKHWDSYGNWNDPEGDNFWKAGNNADRE